MLLEKAAQCELCTQSNASKRVCPRTDNKKEFYKCLKFVDDYITSNCPQNLRGHGQGQGGRNSRYSRNN